MFLVRLISIQTRFLLWTRIPEYQFILTRVQTLSSVQIKVENPNLRLESRIRSQDSSSGLESETIRLTNSSPILEQMDGEKKGHLASSDRYPVRRSGMRNDFFFVILDSSLGLEFEY